MQNIHPTAIIEDGAKMSDGVQIGAFCHISAEVTISNGVIIEPHVTIKNLVHIGEETHIYPHATIGDNSTTIAIGSHCNIREFTQIGMSNQNTNPIQIKSHSYIMAYTQIHSGVTIEEGCTITNDVILHEDCTCQAKAIIGGKATISKGCVIGTRSMIGGASTVSDNIPPFCLVEGYPKAKIRGLNLIGMRRGFENRASINEVKKVFAILKKSSFDSKRASELLSITDDKQAKTFVSFISKYRLD